MNIKMNIILMESVFVGCNVYLLKLNFVINLKEHQIFLNRSTAKAEKKSWRKFSRAIQQKFSKSIDHHLKNQNFRAHISTADKKLRQEAKQFTPFSKQIFTQPP